MTGVRVSGGGGFGWCVVCILTCLSGGSAARGGWGSGFNIARAREAGFGGTCRVRDDCDCDCDCDGGTKLRKVGWAEFINERTPDIHAHP